MNSRSGGRYSGVFDREETEEEKRQKKRRDRRIWATAPIIR
jgi:hypothetical protein